MIVCNRTLEQAKRDFATGKLSNAILLRVPMSRSEWQLQLLGARGDSGMLLALPSLDTQVFASLDAAVRIIEQIGFTVEQLKIK